MAADFPYSKERRDALRQQCEVPEVNHSVRLSQYIVTARQVYFQAQGYALEHDLDNSYIYFRRFISLCLQVIPAHNAYKLPMYTKDAAWAKQMAKAAMESLENVVKEMEQEEKLYQTSKIEATLAPPEAPQGKVSRMKKTTITPPKPPHYGAVSSVNDLEDLERELANIRKAEQQQQEPQLEAPSFYRNEPSPLFALPPVTSPPPAATQPSAPVSVTAPTAPVPKTAAPTHATSEISDHIHLASASPLFGLPPENSSSAANQSLNRPMPSGPTSNAAPQAPANPKSPSAEQLNNALQTIFSPEKQAPPGAGAVPATQPPSSAAAGSKVYYPQVTRPSWMGQESADTAPPPPGIGTGAGGQGERTGFLRRATSGLGGSGRFNRAIAVPTTIMQTFLRIAEPNTKKKPYGLETCGLLAGELKRNELNITTLIIPKQTATANSCTMTNEEELFDKCMTENLMVLGWIHTHPSQTCFMSSLDLHTHCGFQSMLSEAIAIVLAPSDKEKSVGIFRLSERGLEVVQSCKLTDFHPHDSSDYHTADNFRWIPQDRVRVIDLR